MRSQVCVLSWLTLGMFGLACDPDMGPDDDRTDLREPADDDDAILDANDADDADDADDDDAADNADNADMEDPSAPAIDATPRTLAATPYRARGPQQDVPAAALVGWTPCFRETFGPTRTSLFTILLACDKPNLMLACRPTGASEFTVLAHAPRSAVLTDTGRTNAPTIANGTGWYFNDDWSWGFAAEGDPIDRDQCDDNTVANSGLRMCIPTASGETGLGFRCGDNFVYQDTWERVILQAD